MIQSISDLWNRNLGRGKFASTIPPFDGALKPNQALDQARVALELEGVDDLASDGTDVFVVAGRQVLRLGDNGIAQVVLEVERLITAIACIAGGFALALEGVTVRIYGGQYNGRHWSQVAEHPMRAVNALSSDGADIFATDGSVQRSTKDWRHDLMHHGRSGRVYRLSCDSGQSQMVASGLQYAYGVASNGANVLVSESWDHRLLALRAGNMSPLLDRLPGYPSRMCLAAGGGWWVTLFAARTQLVEFVLREPTFRRRMIESIHPDLWIAPQLASGKSFHEPLQGGGIKQMGIVKPWAPPRAYGLILRLDDSGQPLYSLHSRVDGRHHGIVAIVECRGQLFAVSKGAARVLKMNVADLVKGAVS